MATDCDVEVDVKQQEMNSDHDSSLESSSSEDEDGEKITEDFEKDWMCTLAALKTKDPKIYDKNVKFFQDQSSTEKKVKKKKPISLQDVQRKTLIKTEGAPPGDEKIRFEEEVVDVPVVPSYYEEQEQLKKQFQEAASSIPEEGGNILKKKSTENTESDKEEDYRLFLKGKTNKLKKSNKISHELSVLKDFWSKTDLDEGEIFLRDYILNKGYKSNNLAPSYKDIVKDEFSEDEDTLTKQENFEREYNFRFEEPDRKFIKSHPRKILDSVRVGNNARAEKRKAALERKKKEKEIKQEKLKSLKKQKRKEIMEKISKLKEVSGNNSLGIEGMDLDEDFNPEQYDQFMKDAFCDDYYLKGGEDAEKPVFSDDDWQGEYDGDVAEDGGVNEEPGCSYQTKEDLHFEDTDFIMDADYDPTQHRPKKSKKERKKKQKKNQEKPKFNPDEMTFEEYFDEYYKLDYEDLIDDLPCRYKYRSVAPNDFGLETDEILHSTDKELNTWCPLSKVVQYRTEEEEFVSKKMFSKRSMQKNRKKNILTTCFNESELHSSKTTNDKQNKEKGVKNGKVPNVESEGEVNGNIPSVNSKEHKNSKGKKRKRLFDESLGDGNTESSRRVNLKSEVQVNGDTSSANGKQHKNSKNKKQKRSIEESLEEQNMETSRNEENRINKPQKKLMSKDSNSSTAGSSIKSQNSKVYKNKTGDKGNVTKDSEMSNTQLKKKKRAERWQEKKKGTKHNQQLNITMSTARLKAYGINPKKFKYIKLSKQK